MLGELFGASLIRRMASGSYVAALTDIWVMAKANDKEPQTISADSARRWWRALMLNIVALVEDAASLATHDRPGRAQALVILAMEELARARWLYEAAEREWTAPPGLCGLEERPALDILIPEGLGAVRRPHIENLQLSEQLASGLVGIWSLKRRMENYERLDLETSTATAKQRNLRQAGWLLRGPER